MSGHASWGGGTRIQIASVVPVEVRRGLGQTDHKVDDLFRCHADVIRGNHPNRVVAISNQTAEGESALQRNRDPLPGKGVNDVLPGNIEWDEKTYAPVQRDIDTENRFGASLADNRSGGDIATRHDGPAADLNIEICSSPSEGLTLHWCLKVHDRSRYRGRMENSQLREHDTASRIQEGCADRKHWTVACHLDPGVLLWRSRRVKDVEVLATGRDGEIRCTPKLSSRSTAELRDSRAGN